MPKRQKEKQYQSALEHRANQSLRSGSSGAGGTGVSRPLPFDCCALTLTPYANPTCTPDGIVFDSSAITPHLLKHGADPATGRAMTSRDLISLNMDRDESTGRWQCPVLNKPFTDRTKIVAIIQRPPGNEANVYSYEAYRELNVKAKNYMDLTSGLKFSKDKDVVVLQDPDDGALARSRDISNFAHMKKMRDEERSRREGAGGASGNVRHSVTAARVMEKIEREKRKRERLTGEATRKALRGDRDGGDGNNLEGPHAASSPKMPIPVYTDELLTSIRLTTGMASGSLTSTAMPAARANDVREATAEEVIHSQCEALRALKKRGRVRMVTNVGTMEFEIRCDVAPRTAMNFIGLVEKGEYDGSKFHRSIPNFMIQGGKKPGGTKKDGGGSDGGGSLWGKPFLDEFDDRLLHSGAGVLSMANSGPGTNARQFFVMYKSAAHLDRKHSVFGKVVAGSDVLRRMEQIPTDRHTDRPLDTVKIERMEVVGENPVREALESERVRIGERKDEKRRKTEARKSSALGGRNGDPPKPSAAVAKDDTGSADADAAPASPIVIGKYLPKSFDKKKKKKKKSEGAKIELNLRKGDADEDLFGGGAMLKSRLPGPPKKSTFGDFSGW